MDKITITRLQNFIKEKGHQPNHQHEYLLKLVEEVGELAQAIRKNATPATKQAFKGMIEEEVYDVIHYALALANCYDIDVEKWIYVKEKFNDDKYSRNLADSLL